MVSEHWPTYVVLTIYILLTAVVTGIGYYKNKDPDDKHTHITKHFLASKSFGSVILTFTTFASIFSGYTVVGVPTEAGRNGFFASRWLALMTAVGVSMLWLYPRLRRLSMIRSYQSPGDFIEDRFKSGPLSILVALLVSVPQILYIGINVLSLGVTIESLTSGELGFYPVAVAGVIICLVYEDKDVASEYYLRSPSSVTTLNYVMFSLSGISFALNPHITQRALTARSDYNVRTVVVAIWLTTFITMTPGILIGISHISNLPDLKAEYQAYGAYQAMLAVFRDRGGFSSFISYIALLAAVAGIMSTADSALIGVSNTISCDIFKNWLFPDYSSTKIVYIGKAVSLFTMCLCFAFACYIYETGAEYGVVYTIQQGLLWQAVPAYVFGLYSDLGTNAVLLGTVMGTIVDIILIGVVFGGNDPIPLVDKAWSTYVGVASNVIVSAIAHFTVFRNNRGDHDDILSSQRIREFMSGITEPVTKYYGALVWLSLALCLVSAFHWIGAVDEAILDEFGHETTNTLMYNGYVRNVVAGLPDYVFATFIWIFLSMVVGICATMMWTVSSEDTEEEKYQSDVAMEGVKSEKDGILSNDGDQTNTGTLNSTQI